jgi:hypothetical protein
MSKILYAALLSAGLALAASPAAAQVAAPRATPFLPIQNEPAAKLYVDPPLAQPLAARATAIIPYRLENFRILPIFGPAATAVSPRAGHLHVTIDDLPWHWADAGSTGAIILAGLPAGPHRIRIELATPEHRVIAGQAVDFVVPQTSNGHHPHP